MERAYLVGELLSTSVSPIDSDVEVGTPISRTSSQKLGRSPILSSLPHLFTNLRTNDGKDTASSPESRSVLKKLLHIDRSADDLLLLRSSTSSTSKSASSPIDPDLEAYDPELINDSEGIFKTYNGQFRIPTIFLTEGLPVLKVSHKSKKRILLKLDPSIFKIYWKNAFNTTALSTSTSKQRLILPTAIHISKSKIYEFSFDDVKNVITQSDASPYREELCISKEFENQWLTIIYFSHKKGKLKTLHLVADTAHDFKRLSAAINNLRTLREELAKEFLNDLSHIDNAQRDIILNKALGDNEKQLRQHLSFSDVLKYSRRLNININSKHLESLFLQVATEESKSLNFDEFKRFVSLLKSRQDIVEIWDLICGGEQVMTFDIFKRFIREVQKEDYHDDMLYKIFLRFSADKKGSWIPENLNNFLLSKHSSPITSIDEDPSYYDYPMNEYFISSSHNTYLIGRQVAGDSSIEGYIKTLQRGCRCVEVDVWDGSNSDNPDDFEQKLNESEPVVSHGRTFTTAISFTNVIKTIKKYAFVTSPYPVVISLEIRCSISNQLKLVSILKDVLGDTAILYPLDDSIILPSPLQLKNKIILKVKKTSGFGDTGDKGSYSSSTTSTNTSFSEDNGTGRRSSFTLRRKIRKSWVANELSALGVYIQGIKFRNFSLPESKTFNHCFSLSEKAINSMLKDEIKKSSVEKHNRKYFMRIYPSKFRIKSSNFLPMNYWTHGAQMVATNWQTYDLGQQINESYFEGVRKRGYVLKPSLLRKPSMKSSKPTYFKLPLMKMKFSIRIISAHQIPKPKGNERAINPFISFEIIGAKSIEWNHPSMSKGKTSIVSENGFNPIWNDEFSGIITCDNDFIFIRFTICSSTSNSEEDDPTIIGILVAKLSYLKKGYRYLPVNDLLGEELIYSSLFVKIDYEDVS